MLHHHDAVVHDHAHMHVVHYARHGAEVTHLSATHEHEHNHPACDHDHEPHENPEAEHLREGHIHDHGHPITQESNRAPGQPCSPTLPTHPGSAPTARERIGTATAHRLLEDLSGGATVDRFASDQVIIFASLACGRTRVRVPAVTEHVGTGLWLAELFDAASNRLEDRLLTIKRGPGETCAAK